MLTTFGISFCEITHLARTRKRWSLIVLIVLQFSWITRFLNYLSYGRLLEESVISKEAKTWRFWSGIQRKFDKNENLLINFEKIRKFLKKLC